MEDALTLVYKEYAKRNLINSKDYKQPFRISPCHILPETVMFIGLRDGEVIITLSVFPDSPLGLPMDMGYHEEAQTLRDQGRVIWEAGYFAVKSGMFRGQNKSFDTILEKIVFIFTIMSMAVQCGLYHCDLDDACIVTNPDPKKKVFKHFPLDIIGEVKNYGFDEMHINPKPAIAKRVNFRELRPAMNNPLALLKIKNAIFRFTVGNRLPDGVFQRRLFLTKSDLKYFFVEKSDTLRDMALAHRDYVLSQYDLTLDDYYEMTGQPAEKKSLFASPTRKI